MERICLFPGTFDPLTLGHVDIINRALPLFDKIVVGIGLNAAKAPMFSAEQRLHWVSEIYANESRVEGAVYDGLTVDFCKIINELELNPSIETIFVIGGENVYKQALQHPKCEKIYLNIVHVECDLSGADAFFSNPDPTKYGLAETTIIDPTVTSYVYKRL